VTTTSRAGLVVVTCCVVVVVVTVVGSVAQPAKIRAVRLNKQDLVFIFFSPFTNSFGNSRLALSPDTPDGMTPTLNRG
jgi:hypothetical protein